MITNEALTDYLRQSPDIAFVQVDGDGYHYQLVIVSDAFIGKSLVGRQQWVYKKINTYITTGSLHALTMKTWTVQEWNDKHG
jgi:acid stress-induced BolA-like protein IbaG/YrbA